MDREDAVSDVVGRLGVKARAAGISLVFAAQRPDANVMPNYVANSATGQVIYTPPSAGDVPPQMAR